MATSPSIFQVFVVNPKPTQHLILRKMLSAFASLCPKQTKGDFFATPMHSFVTVSLSTSAKLGAITSIVDSNVALEIGAGGDGEADGGEVPPGPPPCRGGSS